MPIKDSGGDVIGVAQVINKMNGECFSEIDEKVSALDLNHRVCQLQVLCFSHTHTHQYRHTDTARGASHVAATCKLHPLFNKGKSLTKCQNMALSHVSVCVCVWQWKWISFMDFYLLPKPLDN